MAELQASAREIGDGSWIAGIRHQWAVPESWFAGDSDERLELAERTGHPYSRLFSRNDLLIVHSLRDEPEETLAVAHETLELCEEFSIPSYLAAEQADGF